MAPPSPWSNIPLELAGLVLRRPPVHVDRVRFAAVCPQWRAAAREFPLPWPLLALPDGTVYSLPGSKPLRLPGCIGYDDACGNWLAFSTEDSCSLRDLFSRATMTLPRLLRIRSPCHLGESLISWIEIGWPIENLTMYKPIFCSHQLVATFIRFQFSTMVAVCLPGAASWWSVHVDHRFELSDDMAFYQGKLYILNDDDHSLFAMDISVDHRTGDPWICQGRRVISNVPIPHPAIRGIRQNEHQKIEMLYLVESKKHGTLLMVHRKTYGKGRIGPRWLVAGFFIPSRVFEFEVFMADFQQSKWTKVTTIGDDQVLFLRRRCSRFIRVSPEDRDRIIFLVKDDEDHDWYEDGRGCTSDSCKVYDMRDGTVSPLVPSVDVDHRSAPATWLFPQV